MRLKSLTLNGYKTFASKTFFEFGDGITCIIGPNGSGKSNVADGIRWSLGEQSFSLLRGKKTDDMIFSGSAKRARASMAEVILTFDNSDGFFPVEFNEIEIGRRAYRDGANEYVLNGNRVRLRDVNDLLGHSGLAERTYTVIGQGLVDNALAQKPEERRALFEEAAGIAAYRDRREDALRKLDETRHNIERAADILSEITPRLNSLERQTARVRQYQVLKVELDDLTKRYFGFYYRRLHKSIADTAETRDKAKHAAAEALAAVNKFDEDSESMRQSRARLRAQIAEAQPRRDAARNANEAALRNLAVMRERVNAADGQIARAQRDVDEHSDQVAAARNRENEATMLMASVRAAHLSKQAELDLAQSASSTDRDAKEQLEAQRDASRRTLIDISAAAVNAGRQTASMRQRQELLRTQIEAISQRTTQLGRQRDEEIAKRDKLIASLDNDGRQGNLFDSQFEDATVDVQRLTNELTAAQASFAAAEAEERLTSRFSVFAEMRAQQSADDLAAALVDTGMPNVRGTLESFVQVLPEDEKAVDAALGDMLHAVIVAGQSQSESQASLNQVRAWLTEQGAGRLLVVPDTIRELDEERIKQDAAMAEFARSRGARPLIDAIQSPDALRPLIQLLAGGAFIARDLQSARELALDLVDGCVVVTRDGEAAYPVGTLSLPAGARAPIVLGAENAGDANAALSAEQARLIDPDAARLNRERAQQTLAEVQARHDRARAALDESVKARDLFAREAVTRRSSIDEHARRIDKLEENLAQLAGEIGQAEAEIEALDAAIVTQETERARHVEAQARAEQDVQSIESKLTAVMAGGWFEAINATQNEFSLSAAALKSNETVVLERTRSIGTTIAQRAGLIKRLDDAHAEQQAHQARVLELTAAAAAAEAAWKEVETSLQPVQAKLAEIDGQLGEHDARKRESERALRECETRLNAVSLEFERANDALAAMRARAAEMMAEQDGADPGSASSSDSAVAASTSQQTSEDDTDPANRVEAYLAALPEVEALDEGLEDRLNQLRGQIKRLGNINVDAQVEYEELKQRHDFLTEQTTDLNQASEQLRQVIAELNDTIKVTFRQTFEAINAAFQNTFKVLFGGGQAKLTLLNPDNIDECGVDIQAQPPGKRPQSLALLSGGERSLTATSLLFAILQVKPTPFCVLDEVDAALDESNVGRFRSMVESLSDNTQFILITHNRRTVEAATTIYGISMAPDGASTALSIRLDDLKQEA
jgi:chromosome segregation protein